MFAVNNNNNKKKKVREWGENKNSNPLVPMKKKDSNNSWSQFSAQTRISSQEFREWMCIPMLWIDVLVDINPSVLPISFSQAFFILCTEISSLFGWKFSPNFDDGGDEKKIKKFS